MTERGAKAVVIGATGLMFVFIALDKTGTTPKAKRVWAAAAVSLGLSLTADIAPDIAAPFAALVLFAMAVHNRGAIGQIIGPPSKVQPVTPSTPAGG